MNNLKPLNYGKHGNLHAHVTIGGITFKLNLFFETEHAYIMKHSFNRCLDNSIESYIRVHREFLYNELKKAVEEQDFQLKTPIKKFLKHNFKSTSELLLYIKQTNL